mgnify:CR=1 FL=1
MSFKSKFVKFAEILLKVLFSIAGVIALIPTYAIRIVSGNDDLISDTKNKIIDFVIGLIILSIGTFGLYEMLQFHIFILSTMDISLAQYFVGVILVLIGTPVVITAATLSCYGILKAIPKVKKAFWDK